MNNTSQLLPQPAHNAPDQIRTLPTGSLDIPDEWHQIRRQLSAENEFAFLPLVVIPSGNRYLVLDGCERLAQQRRSRQPHTWCIILPPVTDKCEQLRIRITLNRYRQFSLREKICYLRWCTANKQTDLIGNILPLLEIDKNDLYQIQKCACCSQEIIEAVCEGFLALSNAKDLDLLDTQDRADTLALLKTFSFSRQTQKELAEWLPEIAFRERCSVSVLLSSPWFREIIDHPSLNAPQKIEKMRQALFDRRFPTIAKTKKTWIQRAAAINPDSAHVVFKPSDAFEKNLLEIKITITSPEQAENIFSTLSKIKPTCWDQLIFPAQTYGESIR